MTKKKKSQILNWVYPTNNWKSNWNRTFIYGWSHPRAKLFVSSDEYLIPEKVKIFPNGNFAQVIKLPNIKNTIRLIQVLNGKRKVISRKIFIQTGHRQQTADNQQQEADKSNGKRIVKIKKSPVVIVIDPGHGGKEHGTHSPKGVPEKKFNLQIAKMLSSELRALSSQLKLKIYLTRTKDTFVSLKNRVNFAKRKKANIVISIHHNALPDKDDPLKHRGVGIYYTHEKSSKLAHNLLLNISKETGLRKYGVYRRDFALTRPNFCKAVLVECGFLTHPLEAEYITKRKIQERIVRGIVNALNLT